MPKDGIIGNRISPVITRASGVYNLRDQLSYRKINSWPTSNIVTAGLQVYLDAGNTSSYPGTGSTWYDISGNSRNATLVGTPTFSSYYFTGISDTNYFSMSNSGIVPRTSDFTYSMWVWFDSSDANDTLFENGSWTDCLLFRYQSGTTLAVYAENTNPGNFSWTGGLSQWYHISLVRYNSIAYLYINGQSTGTPFAFATDINLTNTTMFIGRSQHTTGQSMDGRISTFQVYNRALNSNELIQNYYAQKSRYGR